MEIIEGKDIHRELGNAKHHEHGNAGSLLLRLCEAIFRTGKVVILDSGFCALQAIVALMKLVEHSSILIKNEGISQSTSKELNVKRTSKINQWDGKMLFLVYLEMFPLG